MTAFLETAVTLADVAKVTKTTASAVEGQCAELGLFVGTDWAGRPAVEAVDAHRLVSGAARREFDNHAANVARQSAVDGWEEGRRQAYDRAAAAVYAEASAEGDSGPQMLQQAQAAGRKAAEEYERTTPQPVPDASLSWFGRLKEAVL